MAQKIITQLNLGMCAKQNLMYELQSCSIWRGGVEIKLGEGLA